jgi:hypothetical protein
MSRLVRLILVLRPVEVATMMMLPTLAHSRGLLGRGFRATDLAAVITMLGALALMSRMMWHCTSHDALMASCCSGAMTSPQNIRKVKRREMRTSKMLREISRAECQSPIVGPHPATRTCRTDNRPSTSPDCPQI